MVFSRRQWAAALSAAVAMHALLGIAVFLAPSEATDPEPTTRSVSVSLEPLGDVPTTALPAPEPAESPEPAQPEAASPAPAPAPEVAPEAQAPTPAVASDPPPEEAAAPAPDDPTPETAISEAESIAPEAAGPVDKPQVTQAVDVTPDQAPEEEQPADSPEPATASEPAPATESEAPDEVTAEAAPGQPEQAEPGAASADDTDAYVAQVRSWLARNKRYPERARRLQMEGTVRVRFAVDREGRVLEYRIVDSSGHDLLDQEVEAMIERAQPLPRMPGNLRRNRMELIVPIRFTLN